MQNLCSILEISLNELFTGEHLKEKEINKQAEKNILDILKFNNNKNRKYRFIISAISILLIISFIILGRLLLIKSGYIIDNDLRYTQVYISEYGNIKGNVDINKFGKINIDFDIGANKYGNAVFKNPKKAFKRLKKDYSKGIQYFAFK